jgi:hypothetical protein
MAKSKPWQTLLEKLDSNSNPSGVTLWLTKYKEAVSIPVAPGVDPGADRVAAVPLAIPQINQAVAKTAMS